MSPECKNLPYSVRIVTTGKKIGKLPSSSYLSREENGRFREIFREGFLYEKASRNPIIDKNYKPDGWEREMRTMNFWCRKCLSCVDVRDAEWRVNIVGKPSAGGPCANCGSPVLHRITKMSEAPPDIAAEARAVSRTYRHWQKVRTQHRDEQLQALATLFGRDPQLIDKLASGFGLHPNRVRLILGQG